jgi:alanine racemase
MGRLGVMSEEAFTFAGEISRLKSLEIEGIFTHFAFADLDRKFTLGQVRLLRQLVLRLKACGINIPLVHAANSMGLLGYPQSHFNMVRPGLVLYGLSPKEGALGLKIKPVLSLKSRVVYTKRVPKGFGISYGHTYITPAETTIAVIPIGYGDGYPRRLSNCGPVLMRGRRFSVSGRVCMDQIMVDVGDSRVRTGDEAVLIGSQGRNRVSVEELARLCGTIPYEIVCGLGSRIPRVYK